MTEPYPVLVLGGSGVFGSRICRRLARAPGLRVVVAGRSGAKARRLAAEIAAAPGAVPGAAEVTACAVEVPGGLPAALQETGAKLVIHCCGPFQGQDYRVPGMCIEAGVHYVDLADDRRFVAGIGRLDGAARAAGVLALSGVSSLPALSAAVVESLRPGFARMRSVAIGITPGNRAPRGLAVVRAILSYTGKPIPRWQGDTWRQVYGWQDLRARRLAIAGKEALGRRWFAACDVPDAVLLPERYPELETVTFHAGLELPVLHFGLWALAGLVRGGLLRNLPRHAPALLWLARRFEAWGSERGGMFVEVAGDGPDGRGLTRCWTLIAGSGDGPYVPSAPAVILARKLARGDITRRGALPCLGLLDLEDFTEEVRDLDIQCGVSGGQVCRVGAAAEDEGATCSSSRPPPNETRTQS